MRIEPIRNATRGHYGQSRPSDPRDGAIGGETRALVAVSPAESTVGSRPVGGRIYRSSSVDAAVLAHLLATRDGLAQTRALRRVSIAEGAAAYAAVKTTVKGTATAAPATRAGILA